MAGRSSAQRIAEARRRLETEPNVWVATASAEGVPHLVPLSLAWDGVRIIVATPTATPTIQNIQRTGRARLSLDSADDVVIIEASASSIDYPDATPDVSQAFTSRVGWDPRAESGDWSLALFTPRLVLSWNGVPEIDNRIIMRKGVWRA